MISWPFGLYGQGMHDFVLRELEIGRRAAACEDDERAWWGLVPPAILDIQYEQYVREQEGAARREGSET